ncbi:MAG: bifunctional oligoribonuclease/PAP phosphatase NrnA [Flavobacteriaceae bacterium]|nr:bifunctional oligoribonuclease/PAP phosphatase NrnA [Flavobacteriaceae bacterium]MDZ4148495.1 bifunctional oligoribonuclease/PAP phosphatase NrnA [Flavobacteriaceae bacterium]
MKNTDLSILEALLKTPKKIVITSHYNPDGDAVGSSLALCHFLKKLNHQVEVVLPNELPDFLSWLPGKKDIVLGTQSEEKAKKLIAEAEILFSLDYNTVKRTENLSDSIDQSRAFKVLIDHHREPEDFADCVYWDIEASATCELIYRFIQEFDAEALIDKDIATCIYLGIMTDTGSFKFASTSAETHRIAAKLIEKGIEAADIQSKVFDTQTYDRMQLLGKTLSNMKMIPNMHTAYTYLTLEELKAHNFKKGDTEGFVNYTLALDGVFFGVIFIENQHEPYIKISFRSKGDFDVNTFARQYFSGGGHKNASGGKSVMNMEETIAYFLKSLNEYQKQLIPDEN